MIVIQIVAPIFELILCLIISKMELVATANNTATMIGFKNGANKSDKKYSVTAAIVIKKY